MNGMGSADHRLARRLGWALRWRRKIAGYSCSTFAQKIGISSEELAAYEAGALRMSAEMMWRMAEALECSPADLFEDV